MTTVDHRRGGWLRGGWLGGAFGASCWRGLEYLLLGLPLGLLGWAVALLALVGGVVLGVTVVGVLIVPLLLVAVRAVGWLERWRCGVVRVSAPTSPYRLVEAVTRRARVWSRLRDPATWRDLLWLVLAFPIDLVGVVIAVWLWAGALGLVSIPIWYRFLPGGQAKLYESGPVAHGVIGSAASALPFAALGLVLLWVAGWSTRALAAAQAYLAASLLGPTRSAQLRAKVVIVSASRTAAIDGQQRELHRIERDLHDGAQARLVALSADLGMASEAFDDDPGQARHLVDQARDGVVVALAELRDLVRGIGPPVLRDRGLGAALDSVAARSPIPVTVTAAISRRPPGTVEAAAYFVVCECLANAAKHSRARHISVDVREHEGSCMTTITDDGDGGADPRGTGLRGLAERAAALDGSLTVHSPVGGPTTVRAVFPCGW